MSYILDALRKSQQQRELGSVPRLSTAQHLPLAAPGRAVPLWGIAAVGLAATALAIALYGALRAAPPAPPPPVAAAAPAVVEPAPVRLPPRPTAEEYRPLATVHPSAREDLEYYEDYPVVTRTRPEPRVRYATPSPSVPALSADTYDEVPLFDQLPANARRGIPEYVLNIHVYSDNPPSRFVYVNGVMYREGDATGEGGLVEAITPTGVVVMHGSQEFRLKL